MYVVGSELDSIDELVVGNVNKFVVVLFGYLGRLKKGYLIFDVCFECGMGVIYFKFIFYM